MPLKTEYNRNYQWDRTWNNAPHPRERIKINNNNNKLENKTNVRINLKGDERPPNEPLKSSDKLKTRNKKIQAHSRVSDKMIEEEIQRIKDELAEKKQRLAHQIKLSPRNIKPVKEKKNEDLNKKEIHRPKTAPAFNKKEMLISNKPIEPTINTYKSRFERRHYPDSFITEYQKNFQPFIYASHNDLDKISKDKINRVFVIPKSHSKERARSLTPHSKIRSPLCFSRFSTTYDNTFGHYTSKNLDPKKRPSSALAISIEDLVESRQKAELYKKRDISSHFSRDHLAQLCSDDLNLWEPPIHNDLPDLNIRSKFPSFSDWIFPNIMKAAGVPTKSEDPFIMDKVFSWDDYSLKDDRKYRFKDDRTYIIPAGLPSFDDHPLVTNYHEPDSDFTQSRPSGRSNTREISDVEIFKDSITDRSSIISSISLAEETLRRAKENQRRLESIRGY